MCVARPGSERAILAHMPASCHRPRIRIDKEFRALIPPLTPGERTQLEENIVAAGRAMDPLVLWGDVLLDGHNRFDICTKHRLPFTTTQVRLANRRDAKAWIVRRQFGRRNLTPFQRIELALKLAPLIAAQAKANQGRRTDIHHNRGASLTTDRELAKLAGISHNTVHKGRVLDRDQHRPHWAGEWHRQRAGCLGRSIRSERDFRVQWHRTDAKRRRR